MIDPAAWFPVAKLLRPQGRKGELLADPLTDAAGIFLAGRELTLVSESGATQAIMLEGFWHPSGKNAGRVVLKLSGCDSITAAEAFAGASLILPASEEPKLDSDTFFVRDLVGCVLYTGGIPAGMIVDLHFPTTPDGRTRIEDAAPLLVLESAPGAEPMMVPFVKAWLDRVDLAAKTITMRLPEGLLDVMDEDEG